jgi:Gametolysin peptidase M11
VSVAQQPGHVSWIRYRNPGMSTLVHELGHNLGLAHAYGVVCSKGDLRVPLGGRCRSVEYGDSWDAMGHSNASFSVPVLSRLGWAGAVATASTSGSYRLADVEHSGRALQGVRIPAAGRVTYWVEYQPEHSTEIGRSIPGVTIRRQVGRGPVEIVDASPGNPAGIADSDRDLSNPALPVGSSITTPEGVRLTTVSVGRAATVDVQYGLRAGVPDAPTLTDATLLGGGRYQVHWQSPADNGQIVLGYQVTAQPSGAVTFVRSPGAYRTTAVLPVGRHAGEQTFTVEAVNQVGWSARSGPVSGQRPVERQGRSLSPAT